MRTDYRGAERFTRYMPDGDPRACRPVSRMLNAESEVGFG
jgi:hypothetical protein